MFHFKHFIISTSLSTLFTHTLSFSHLPLPYKPSLTTSQSLVILSSTFSLCVFIFKLATQHLLSSYHTTTMHKCCSTNNNTSHVGSSSCTCGLFHAQNNSAFSVLFSMPKPDHHYHHHHLNNNSNYHISPSSYSTYPSSSVDCTLSLGTPSTRMSDGVDQRRAGPCVSSFCWDLLQPKHTTTSLTHPQYKVNRGGGVGGGCGGGTGHDPLLARRCANCDTTSTPLWRNGPRGPKSLCNACGIRFKKEERRATQAATASGGGTVIDAQQHLFNNSWVHHAPPPQKVQCFSPAIGNEFRFIDEDASRDSDNGISILSWRLNVHG